jgi:HAD superfamily hydrolase (TIGR01450 family)
VTMRLIDERAGARVLHIGPERDLSLFDAAAGPRERPKLVSLSEAEYAVCTGLRHDETETPDDYEPELRALADRGLMMVCANPDIVIHRGDDLIYCAGALARRYEELGGSVIYAGKPHRPIYDRALAQAGKARGGPVEKPRVLAIGDGMKTDIVGAARAGLDALFVTGGIHRSLHKATLDQPADPAELQRLYDESEAWPVAAIPMLRP